MDTIKGLYEVIENRKANPEEGSYTCYLFDKGLDKILKKCGEECSEMIIASKNEDPEELKNEICDLVYHMLVLMCEKGVRVEDVQEILEERRQKIGNLKQFHQVDRNS
ncbi:MAG: phosphoribosyl-ATP diphosphatase [Oscillospiraceae bacterium]|jgi:phosphoribosyl-ATP pyrophosphohydrolase